MTRKLASGSIHQVSCMRENSAVPSTQGEIHVHVQCMHVQGWRTGSKSGGDSDL